MTPERAVTVLTNGGAALTAISIGIALSIGPPLHVGNCPSVPKADIPQSLSDSRKFPIAVWLQSPANAAGYRQAGINLYVALSRGPTDEQLTALRSAGMEVICAQNARGLAHVDDPTIAGWMHGDEPDNAQEVRDPVTGKRSYGPCIPPEKIVSDYLRMKQADPKRPVLLNLGQGVANDQWIGRGNGAKLSDYETYVKGGDIISFDVYPVAGLHDAEKLWYVAKGVERLVRWSEGKRRIWACIECTAIDGMDRATPAQVKAEIWMAIVSGAKGIIYFVHQFKPSFNEHALLDDREMLPAVTAINRQLQDLAPVLNGPDIHNLASVTSNNELFPIALLVKSHAGATFLAAVGTRNGATKGSFVVKGLHDSANVEVIGENRALLAVKGRFEDEFKPYEVHLYKLTRR